MSASKAAREAVIKWAASLVRSGAVKRADASSLVKAKPKADDER